MPERNWLERQDPAFRLMMATSWLAPESWQQHQEATIRAAVSAGIDWDKYLALVVRHRTQVLSWLSLQRVEGLAVPEAALCKMRDDATRMQKGTLRQLMMLGEVLRAFEQAGIPLMLLKGPQLSQDLYGNPTLRQARDLDFVCRLEDIQRARNLLLSIGFRFSNESLLRLPERLWPTLTRCEYHLEFVHAASQVHIELHWREWNEDTEQAEGRWRKATQEKWQGFTFWKMNPLDQAVYLCEHGGRHAWFRAKWLGDMAALYATGSIDWEACMARARVLRLAAVVPPLLLLLHELYSLPLPRLKGVTWKRYEGNFKLDACRALLRDEALTTTRILKEVLRIHLYMLRVTPTRVFGNIMVSLTYSQANMLLLRLPNRLFWLYMPLRPFLFVWRHLLAGKKAS